MRMTPIVFAVLSIALVLSATSCSKNEGHPNGAEAVLEQKDHLFKLSPPKGWGWHEQPGNVKISDPRTGNGISIQFASAGTHSEDEIRELLRNGNQAMIERVVKPSGGTVIKEEERQLGGAYARQLTFLQSHKGQQGTVTYISLVTKGYAFTVTFGGPDKNQVAEMQASVETLRFD